MDYNRSASRVIKTCLRQYVTWPPLLGSPFVARQTGQSIDYHLRDASHIRDQTIRLLTGLESILIELRDLTSVAMEMAMKVATGL